MCKCENGKMGKCANVEMGKWENGKMEFYFFLFPPVKSWLCRSGLSPRELRSEYCRIIISILFIKSARFAQQVLLGKPYYLHLI